MSSSPPNPAAPVRLHRALGLSNLIFIGLVIIQPTAPMGIYGVISNKAHGHVVTTILIAMVAMLFTAVSYGRMARVYPSAGSAYTYVGQEMHPALGYFVGWAQVMDYLLNPLICTAFCAKAAMNILPALSFYVWIIIFAAFFTWTNLRGIRTSARLNEALCIGMTIVVVIFLAAVARAVFAIHHGPGYFTNPFYRSGAFEPSAVFAGTSVAVLSYIGFDAVSTLSEEVHNPRRNIMLAAVLALPADRPHLRARGLCGAAHLGRQAISKRPGGIGFRDCLATSGWRTAFPDDQFHVARCQHGLRHGRTACRFPATLRNGPRQRTAT